ncbi:MAG TPA: FimV/HubP family polar landmark protein [Rhodanobacter sp.]
MNRSLKLPLLVALALGSGHALALDLGQIQVKSALGQPLLAEIPVQKATPAELQQLNVQLASGEEFARAGVAGGRPTIPLHFDVVDGGNGRKVIRITSDAAVNDPFLDLLIEIHGGSGKSVREYTILLDPPGSSPAPTQVASRPSTRTARPAVAAPAARAASQASPGEQVANGRFGPVERGQTLSAVAHQTAPAGVDVNQMLLALKQANPDAFYRDNINALKAGAVLRIPDKAAAEAVAVAAAAAEVRRQNGDWRSGTVSSSPVSVADAGTRATTSSSPTAAAGSTGDHLALVPAKQGSKAAPTSGGSDKALRQDLQRSQEAMASLQQQGEDLKSRLKELGDINSKNERLLALKDNEIAELQQKLAAARQAAGQPAEPAHAATTVAAPVAAANASKAAESPAGAASAPTAGSEAVATAATAQTPAAASTAPAAAKPVAAAASTTPIKPTAIKPAPVASEEPWYTQLWAQALGAVVILLLLLGALLGRRRKAKPAAVSPKLAPSLADRFGDAPSADGGDDADQNMLLDQLAEHPDDISLHLELVSLYYSRRDVEHFEAAAEAMHAHVTDPQQEEWQDVLHMGEDLVPGHPLFAGHDGMPADERDAHQGFDIDQYAAEPAAAPAPAAPAASGPPPLPANPVKVSEYNFNFDLTPAHEAAPKRADSGEPAPAAAGRAAGADDDATVLRETASSWHFDEPELQVQPAGHDIEPRDFSDDPVDTKLDLARAYLDMGDPDGARAMLEEVLHEGSQTQRDVAKRMLDDLH